MSILDTRLPGSHANVGLGLNICHPHAVCHIPACLQVLVAMLHLPRSAPLANNAGPLALIRAQQHLLAPRAHPMCLVVSLCTTVWSWMTQSMGRCRMSCMTCHSGATLRLSGECPTLVLSCCMTAMTSSLTYLYTSQQLSPVPITCHFCEHHLCQSCS